VHDHISRCAAAVEVLNDEMTRTKEWRTMVDERVTATSLWRPQRNTLHVSQPLGTCAVPRGVPLMHLGESIARGAWRH
jgi:hypothetical protein